jgi:hypothetical protein
LAVVVAVAGSALLVARWPTVSQWVREATHSGGVGQVDELGLQAAGQLQTVGKPGSPGILAGEQPPQVVSVAIASDPAWRHLLAASGYLNPLRGIAGLVPERVDEGVDFGGTGPIYAIGPAVILTSAGNAGWPGGGWITYQLTSGPAKGLMVYVAEDVTATVQPGQKVTSSTVIANMWAGGDGIETGWAAQDSSNAESALAEAGGIGGGGPYPTQIGVDFDVLLQSLGVPAAPNASQPAYGILPAAYPVKWR